MSKKNNEKDEFIDDTSGKSSGRKWVYKVLPYGNMGLMIELAIGNRYHH